MNALDYFLKANLYGLLFAGCYWLFLRRHTFFSLNRAYLLSSAVFSLVLPLVSLPTQTVETLPSLDWPVPVGIIALPATGLATAPVETGPDWEQIGLMVYGFVALVFLLRIAVRVGRLMWLIYRSPRQTGDGYMRVLPNDPTIPTFSFFGYMVLNPADVQNTLIIGHEQVHIEQHHSVDVMGMALLRAVFWGCPALWLIDRMLRQVHEFLADKPTNQSTDYALFLVEYTFNLQPDTMTNGFFNPSLLKQRIQMLHQRATTRWALGKYAVVIPLAFSLLAMTTAREEIAAVVSQSTDEPIIVSGRVTSSINGKPIPGAIVMVASTGKGIPTDVQGRFTLKNVPKTAALSISFIGFTTMAIPVNGHKAISAALAPADPNELPTMGATAAYKAIKPNPAMPVRTPPSSETIHGEVYTAVEEPAVFPTGIPGLMQYVAHELRYPAKAQAAGIQGNVFVQFVVLPTGAIGSAKIKKGLGSGCDEEALRVVRQMPRWIPGKQNGKTVATQYVLPIQFALETKDDKRTGQVSTQQPDSGRKTAYTLDNTKNSRFALYNDVQTDNKQRYSMPLPDSLRSSTSSIRVRDNGLSKGNPLYLLNGTTEIPSLEAINSKDIERLEVNKDPSAQLLYGPKAANGVVIIYMNGAYQQSPEFIRQTLSEINKSPAKETEYTINRKKATDKEFRQLKVEDIRAIGWQKGPGADYHFQIVNIYTR